jgi:TRAP-type C4-dicarboxylate transport system permease small subunit
MTLGVIRLVALLSLPLAALVVPTLLVRPLLPPELTTAWPILAFILILGAFVVVASMSYRWTHSLVRATLLTLASLGAGLAGLYAMFLWALTGTWG